MKKFLVMLVMLVGVFAMTGCGSSSLVGNIIKDEGSLDKIMDEFEVDEETARTDVEGFVGALYEHGLVLDE